MLRYHFYPIFIMKTVEIVAYIVHILRQLGEGGVANAEVC